MRVPVSGKIPFTPCMMRALWDYVSLGIVGLIAYPVLRLATTGRLVYAVMLLGVALADYATKLVKDVTCDSDVEAFKRPPGATDCDFFCRNGDCEGNPGMPSGHMATTAFTLTFIYLAEDLGNRKLYVAFAVLFLVLMGLARHGKRCHTVLQIVLGAAWGAACAAGVYALWARA